MIEGGMVGATAPSPPRDGVSEPSPASGAPAAFHPGRVGHYELRQVLGQGGHGTVWEAWDTRLKRAVALKALSRRGAAPDAGGLREARVTARMRHPAFVAVHEVIHETWDGVGQTWLAMELVEGRTLAAVAAEGPADEARVRAWMRQAAEALAEAHGQGVAHGDIKPSNLMIEPSGRLRLLDLGIAACHHADPAGTLDVTASGPAGGTLAYMAPERLLGAEPDAAGDAYALGLTMHELLTGRRATDGVGGLALAHRRLSEDVPLPRGPCADSPLFALIDDMTRRDPARRAGNLARVAARLAAGADAAEASHAGAPVRAAAPGAAPPRSRERLVRWRAAAVIAGALLVALAAVPLVQRAHRGPSARDLQVAELALHAPDDTARIDAAIATFESALARDPAQARAAAALAIGYCLRHAGNERDTVWVARAGASAQVALRVDDGLALAHAAQAWVLELRGELESARAEYERALAIDPSDFHALNGLAQLLMRSAGTTRPSRCWTAR
jgi:serine/threonine-protein kinase